MKRVPQPRAPTWTRAATRPTRLQTAAAAWSLSAEGLAACRDTAPKRTGWLQKAAPEGLAAFALPEPRESRPAYLKPGRLRQPGSAAAGGWRVTRLPAPALGRALTFLEGLAPLPPPRPRL